MSTPAPPRTSPPPRPRTRPPLVVGLGNPMAGDDGVGRHVARRLRGHPRLPPGTEVLEGDDLLRLEEELVDRAAVYIIDALLDEDSDAVPGTLRVEELDSLDDRGGSAHQLPPAQALRLLRSVHPGLRDVPVVLFGISIRDVSIGEALSPTLGSRLPGIVDRAIEEMDREV